jgi:hypothetical protein
MTTQYPGLGPWECHWCLGRDLLGSVVIPIFSLVHNSICVYYGRKFENNKVNFKISIVSIKHKPILDGYRTKQRKIAISERAIEMPSVLQQLQRQIYKLYMFSQSTNRQHKQCIHSHKKLYIPICSCQEFTGKLGELHRVNFKGNRIA